MSSTTTTTSSSSCAQAGFGNYIKIVGSHEQLGLWEPKDAPTMEWGEGHTWTTAIQVTYSHVKICA